MWMLSNSTSREGSTSRAAIRYNSGFQPVVSSFVRKWRNWQTRKPQELVAARQWRFKSSLPHQITTRPNFIGPFLFLPQKSYRTANELAARKLGRKQAVMSRETRLSLGTSLTAYWVSVNRWRFHCHERHAGSKSDTRPRGGRPGSRRWELVIHGNRARRRGGYSDGPQRGCAATSSGRFRRFVIDNPWGTD